jgi:hypothetical protein
MIINSIGKTVPPVFFFPRARHHNLLVLCTTWKLGVGDSPQNRMTGPLFLKVLERVKKHTRTSKEGHVILTVDSHESHITLDSILYARENGITLVTFLPHRSH